MAQTHRFNLDGAPMTGRVAQRVKHAMGGTWPLLSLPHFPRQKLFPTDEGGGDRPVVVSRPRENNSKITFLGNF